MIFCDGSLSSEICIYRTAGEARRTRRYDEYLMTIRSNRDDLVRAEDPDASSGPLRSLLAGVKYAS